MSSLLKRAGLIFDENKVRDYEYPDEAHYAAMFCPSIEEILLVLLIISTLICPLNTVSGPRHLALISFLLAVDDDHGLQ